MIISFARSPIFVSVVFTVTFTASCICPDAGIGQVDDYVEAEQVYLQDAFYLICQKYRYRQSDHRNP